MNLTTILQHPIPDMTARRARKDYRSYPLDVDGQRNSEPLVDIAEFGIAGQSYYSRHNTASGQPISGVGEAVFVRHSVAEKLALINRELQQSQAVTELLGGRVELFVDEGLRSKAVQQKLYAELFPRLIRERNPGISKADALKLRDSVIAKPSNKTSPAPHATGAAVDVKFRYVQAEQGFVSKGFVDMGHSRGDLGSPTQPDYFERLLKPPRPKLQAGQIVAQRHRRVFYWVMRGALIGDDSGFEVNPNEWWHWSYGDQLWGQLRRAPYAFFGAAPELNSNN